MVHYLFFYAQFAQTRSAVPCDQVRTARSHLPVGYAAGGLAQPSRGNRLSWRGVDGGYARIAGRGQREPERSRRVARSHGGR